MTLDKNMLHVKKHNKYLQLYLRFPYIQFMMVYIDILGYKSPKNI